MHSKPLAERVKLTTSRSLDEAVECEVAAFNAWLLSHIYTTYPQIDQETNLQWMRAVIRRQYHYSSEDQYIVTGHDDLNLYEVFRRLPTQTAPRSFPAMAAVQHMEMCMV